MDQSVDCLLEGIGSYPEIEPYFPIWENLATDKKGILAVIEVEHDETAPDVPAIKKGTDGRALV